MCRSLRNPLKTCHKAHKLVQNRGTSGPTKDFPKYIRVALSWYTKSWNKSNWKNSFQKNPSLSIIGLNVHKKSQTVSESEARKNITFFPYLDLENIPNWFNLTQTTIYGDILSDFFGTDDEYYIHLLQMNFMFGTYPEIADANYQCAY